MKQLKTYILAVASVLLLGVQMTSCSDDMPAESYYSFTGQMVSDYLQQNPNYSEFAAIVTRAGLMDQLSAYGTYTCFAATNDAVYNYLAARGYGSVNDIPQAICDTIARMHLMSYLCYTADFINQDLSELPYPNMLRDYLPMSIDTIYNTDSTEILATNVMLNNRAIMVKELMNDSVENGVVHTVNAIMEASSETVDKMLKYNKRTTIFYDALRLTGVADTIANHVRDITWDPEPYTDVPGYPNNLVPSHTHNNLLFPPESRKYGYTIFAIPDDVIATELSKAGIQTTGVRGLYDYACKVYEPYYKTLWAYVPDSERAFNETACKSPNNPLYKLIAYHVLDRALTTGKFVCITTIDIARVDPTEWYETLAPHASMKIQKATASKYYAAGDRNKFFINRICNARYPLDGNFERGAMIITPTEDDINNIEEISGSYYKGRNGYYYYVDRILSYGEVTRNKVFNDRMRIELGTLFPELTNNDILGNGKNWMDHNEKSTEDGKNYWFPKGYLKNVKQVGDGIFLYQKPYNYYWSYQGDEFNLTGNSYDISIRLLPFPEGQYEIRLGFCSIPQRGIGQIYFDGKPQGIPLDMRIYRTDPSIGTGSTTKKWEVMTEEERSAEQKLLKNNGYYRGPASVFNYHGSTYIQDGQGFIAGKSDRFYDNDGTVRKVICQVNVDGEQDHWLRFRSVYAEKNAQLMIDYLEIVPKSVYGIDDANTREDDL